MSIRDLADINYGFSLPERDRNDGDVKVYASSGVVGTHDEFSVSGPSIVIGRKGSVGSVFYSEENIFPIDTAYYINETKNNTNLKFLYYLLKRINLPRYSGDSAVPGLNRDAVYGISVEIPGDDSTQEKIAEILSSYDEKIENNSKIIETLEKIAKSIFKEWFGDFHFPHHEKTKFVDSSKGKIPEDWRVEKIKSLADVKSGYAFKSSEFVDSGFNRVVKIKNVLGDGKIDTFDTSFISEELAVSDKVKQFKLTEGDILLAMSGNTTGKIGIVYGTTNNLFLNQRVGKFLIKDDLYKNFLYLFLMSNSYEKKFLGMGYGSAQPNISPSQVEGVDIVIPPEKIIEEFEGIINSIFQKIYLIGNENIKLAEMRDLLLNKLI